MILKKVDSKGNKYYINAFNGKVQNPMYVRNNGKKESNKQLEFATMERMSMQRVGKSKEDKMFDQWSAFVGQLNELHKNRPNHIGDYKYLQKYIKAARRVDVYPVLRF